MRFDERGMVVAFNFKDHRLAVADIDHAGVFSRTLQNPWPLGGQLF